MFNRLIVLLLTLLIILVGTFMYVYSSMDNEIETTWERHENLDLIGWNETQLAEARRYYDSINSTAVLVIYQGKILLSWGDVTKNTNIHSVRKSILSALLGNEINNGTLSIDSSLFDLDIDDNPPLTDQEKFAHVKHLMTSTSGVYLPAGEESWGMRFSRPSRGSSFPGKQYYYNNWDFNVLGTIYNRTTERDLFEDFAEKIATPLGMEDFTISQTNYKYENRRSQHPSYLFQMSARDLARFGQLYLQKGTWNGEQIIPRSWITESTKPHVDVPYNNIFDYGYLWWVAVESPFKDLGMYSAVGRYGQSIDILPEMDLVFVHRVDSNSLGFAFTRNSVNDLERLQLLQLILDAKRKDD